LDRGLPELIKSRTLKSVDPEKAHHVIRQLQSVEVVWDITCKSVQSPIPDSGRTQVERSQRLDAGHLTSRGLLEVKVPTPHVENEALLAVALVYREHANAAR
jgi:hypothetical protein